MSSEITIIIPTKNRSHFLSNCIEYYVLNNFKGSLMILDSSNIKEKNRNKEITFKFKQKIKLQVFYKDDFPTQIIKNFIKKVKTKYCIMASDDDFYIIKTINYFVNYLNTHKNINIINGKALRLDIVNTDRVLVNKYFISDKLNKGYPLERVSNYINEYGPINTSIISTKYLVNILGLTPSKRELKTKCPIRSINDEILVGALMVLSSKIIHKDKLFLIRTIHGNNSNLPKDHNKKKLDKSIDFFIKTIKKFADKYLYLSENNDGYETLRKDMYQIFKKNSIQLKVKIKFYSYLKFIKSYFYNYSTIRFIINKLRNKRNLLDNYIKNELQFYRELKKVKSFIIKT
tara:strand:+ start:828 stop:1862 length:1035 start_codon:yes stop_codon:yes gene_type:complete